MKKHPKITEQTKQTLVKFFLLSNKENKIHKITINDICKMANYNRSTFYQYFSDIYDLRNFIENKLYQILYKIISTSILPLLNKET